jgi:uncharacterized protein (TIGR02996 family)
MTTRDDLLRAVLANEADDAARLVYADWVEQQGDPVRAQVIHLQCELARHGAWDRRRLELAWELDHALAQLGEGWRDELPVFDGVEWLGLERGFASAVRLSDLATLEQLGGAIREAAPVSCVELALPANAEITRGAPPPWLRVLRMIAPTPRMAPLLALAPELELELGTYDESTWLTRPDDAPPLVRLAIRGSDQVGAALAQQLADARWAAGLESLELPSAWVNDDTGYADDPRLGEAGGRALAGLRGLAVLNVDGQRIGAGALGRLLALPALRELSARENNYRELDALTRATGAPFVRLDVGRNAIGTAGARRIASAPRCRELQYLGLDTCEVESIGLAELARAPLWQTLRVLDLSRNPLGASAVRMLADAPPPPHLHTLRLEDADLDEAAAHVLAKVEWLGRLAVLALSGNRLGRGAAALREITPEGPCVLRLASIGAERGEAAAIARFWPRAVELDLGNNAIGDAGLERFAATREAALLQTLVLRDCALTDDGLELLAGARVPRLRALDLAGNPITARGLSLLVGSGLIARLEHFDLSRTSLDGEAITALIAVGPLPQLRRLSLRAVELGERDLLRIANAESLRGVLRIDLSGTPWTYAESTRITLARRFGAEWYQDR